MILVKFKSIPENYVKEKDGRKPNTERVIEATDVRWKKLSKGIATHVRITNTETGEYFTRKITDVTFWNGIVVISWRHVAFLNCSSLKRSHNGGGGLMKYRDRSCLECGTYCRNLCRGMCNVCYRRVRYNTDGKFRRQERERFKKFYYARKAAGGATLSGRMDHLPPEARERVAGAKKTLLLRGTSGSGNPGVEIDMDKILKAGARAGFYRATPRDPKRILRIVSIIYEMWNANPDWRFGQLLENCLGKGNLGWNTEDDKTEERLIEAKRSFLGEIKEPEISHAALFELQLKDIALKRRLQKLMDCPEGRKLYRDWVKSLKNKRKVE